MATPVRQQYLDMKARYPGCLLLFRMGDFYETFDDDAKLAARDLEIALTKRDMGGGEVVPLAGIPYHALDSYLAKLIKAGHRVAICEQTSEPNGRTLVERDVVRVVTPGTVLEPALLDAGANNYLAAVVVGDGQAGIAYVDITTGEFAVTQVPEATLRQEIARLAPSEVVAPKGDDATLAALRTPDGHGGDEGLAARFAVTPIEPGAFASRLARQRLLDHFEVTTLDAFGCERLPLAVAAAGAVLEYVGQTHRAALPLLTGLQTYAVERFMVLDPQTRRNLELFEGGRWGGKEHSLLSVLNLTRTSMGARLLRRWIGEPLLDLDELTRRQDAVGWLAESGVRRQRLQAALGEVADVERLLHRIGVGVASPREVVALRRSLEQVPPIKAALAEGPSASSGPSTGSGWAEVGWLESELLVCEDAVGLIREAVAEDPQGEVGQGNVVRPGFSAELDELRSASQDARSYIAGLERRERERTGIPNLKVGYNKVFGYYLEVTNPHLASVPDDYVRRQTLVNAERFYTPELKDHENRVLNARERLEELETSLFRQVCRQIAQMAAPISRTARALAMVDTFVSLAEAAVRFNYARPTLSASSQLGSPAPPRGGRGAGEQGGEVLWIKAGRHPVVERFVPSGTFVPNDTLLSTDSDQLIVLTGPNMAGKSTYLRQVALIVLMAQIGSFVPADEAHVGLVDRIFTRVGLQDDLSAGQSTFMVEMIETASILHHATRRSLVVLDEIGRGTSTYDGLSIAQAVAEHIHNAPRLGCRTLFATHYHELTELAHRLPRVRNYNVAVIEEEGEVVFLHRIVPGGADRSYGVHVARLAGLPRPVVQRAWELLAEHEGIGGKGEGERGRQGEGEKGRKAAVAGGAGGAAAWAVWRDAGAVGVDGGAAKVGRQRPHAAGRAQQAVRAAEVGAGGGGRRMTGKPIRLSGHARDQLAYRGVTEAEVLDTIRSTPWRSAERGRLECAKDFAYNAIWNGVTYTTKRVRPIFVDEAGEVVVITIYSYFFQQVG